MHSIADIPDSELLKRAVRNCRRPTRSRLGVPLWSVVGDRFALGSTFATELCRRFELDPSEMTKPSGRR
jgi:hypothetical protein